MHETLSSVRPGTTRARPRWGRQAPDHIEDPVVFVVDDDPSILHALTRLIRSVDLQVEAFESAQELLRRDPHAGPSCLVLDVRLPGLTGLDLQNELAKAGHDLPIIFITGHGDVPTSVRAMKAGAVDFFEKPFDDHHLLTAIDRAIEGDAKAWRERGVARSTGHPKPAPRQYRIALPGGRLQATLEGRASDIPGRRGAARPGEVRDPRSLPCRANPAAQAAMSCVGKSRQSEPDGRWEHLDATP